MLFSDMMLGSEEIQTRRGDPNEENKMTDTITRQLPQFDLSLDLHDADFVKPPKESQRNWLIQQSVNELVSELYHLDKAAKSYVPGSQRVLLKDEWKTSPANYDGSQLIIQGHQVMQEWERPVMKAMAEWVAETHGDVLEVGFGMGISATYIQEVGVKSYTLVECNDGVIEAFEKWRLSYPNSDIRLIRGKWQDTTELLGSYDGVFFDAYATSEEEITAYVRNSVTFAQAFFPVASNCLREGGVFTYFTDEVDSFSRAHQRAVLEFFRSMTLSAVRPLFPPQDCNYWWEDSMMIVKAIK